MKPPKKVSLATIAEQIAKLDARMECSFGAVAEDIAGIKNEMGTKIKSSRCTRK